MKKFFDIVPCKEVVGYNAGVPCTIKVKEVAPDKWLEVHAADAFTAMRVAALADGIRLKVNSAWRSKSHQQRLWDDWHAWLAGWDQQGYRRPRPARPGRSKHHNGVAVDIQRSHGDMDGDGINEIDEWLNKNAYKYGFYKTVRGEPWHFEWRKQ